MSPLDIIFIILVDSQGYVRYNENIVRRKEYQQEDDIKEPTEECELRDHAQGFLKSKNNLKKSNKKRHHAHTAEDSSSDEECEFYWFPESVEGSRT